MIFAQGGRRTDILKKALLASLIAFLLFTSGCVPQENCRISLYGEAVDAATGMGLPDVSWYKPWAAHMLARAARMDHMRCLSLI